MPPNVHSLLSRQCESILPLELIIALFQHDNKYVCLFLAQYTDEGKIYQIDMKLPGEYHGKRRQTRAATSEKKRLWPGGIIPYRFHASIGNVYWVPLVGLLSWVQYILYLLLRHCYISTALHCIFWRPPKWLLLQETFSFDVRASKKQQTNKNRDLQS